MAQVLTFLLYIPFLLLSHFIKFIPIKIVDICKTVYSFTHHSITIYHSITVWNFFGENSPKSTLLMTSFYAHLYHDYFRIYSDQFFLVFSCHLSGHGKRKSLHSQFSYLPNSSQPPWYYQEQVSPIQQTSEYNIKEADSQI